MRAPHWKVFYRPPPPLLESISDSVHCRVAQEGCIVRREKWMFFTTIMLLVLGGFRIHSQALSVFPQRFIFWWAAAAQMCHALEYFVAVKYFTLDPNCTFKNISRCNITHAHLIPGGENTDFYCYCCIVTHPICVSKEAAASFKKVIASLQLPSPGSFLSNFLQVLLRSIFRQFLSQLCIMSKVCSVI